MIKKTVRPKSKRSEGSPKGIFKYEKVYGKRELINVIENGIENGHLCLEQI